MIDPKKLEQERKSRKLSQAFVANALCITKQQYIKYETDGEPVPPSMVEKIAILFDKPQDYFKPEKTEADIQAEIDELVNVIINKFGPQHQACVLIEEMSELTKVLCKIQRGKFVKGKLNEEFTHVQVSCEVIRRLMAIKNQDISEQVRLKLQEYAEN